MTCQLKQYLEKYAAMIDLMIMEDHENALCHRDILRVVRAFVDPDKDYQLVDGLAKQPQEWDVKCVILGVLCEYRVYAHEGEIAISTHIPQPPIKGYEVSYAVYKEV